MKFNPFARLSVCLLAVSSSCLGGVDFWEASKGVIYDQTEDNTAPESSTNWFIFAAVETDSPGDASSATLEGGQISGPIAFEWFDGEWEAFASYPTKAALDADFPSGTTYSIILAGGTLGSVTQEFEVVADAYPDTPYLLAADYSSLQALPALEPFELNWNHFGTSAVSVAFQISEESVFDGDEVLYEDWGFAQTSFVFSNGLLTAGVDYEALVEFVNSTNSPDTGGFGAEGKLAFSALLRVPIIPVNTAIGYDEFSDESIGADWTVIPDLDMLKTLSETNGHIAFASDDSPEDLVIWLYEGETLSYTQDWSFAVDIANLLDESALTNDQRIHFELVLTAYDLINFFVIESVVEEALREVTCLSTKNGSTQLSTSSGPISDSKVSVKISFDADTKMLTGAYSLGGDYIILTNVTAATWGVTDSNTFLPAISCGANNVEVPTGSVYADNFRVYGEPAISNHVRFVEIEYIKSFGSPDDSGDDVNEWNVMVQTDQRVTSAAFTLPDGEQIEVEEVYDAGTTLSWEFEDEEDISNPFDTDLDDEWLFTVGLADGTFHSTAVPFTKEDGVTAIPLITSQPLFSVVDLAGDLSSVVFEWDAVDPLANFVDINKDSGEDDLTVGFYSDGITDDVGLAPVFDGPLSTRISAAAPLDIGENEFTFANSWARTAYNDEGIPYVVIKLSESFYLIDTEDLDGDGLDDAWEIEFFGSTNAPNGGASEDFDFDGQTNRDEFIGGANPTNDASVFEIGMAAASPEGFVLSWTAVEDRYYGVYWTESLTNEFEALELYMEYPRNSFTDLYHTVEDSGFYVIDVMLAE